MEIVHFSSLKRPGGMVFSNYVTLRDVCATNNSAETRDNYCNLFCHALPARDGSGTYGSLNLSCTEFKDITLTYNGTNSGDLRGGGCGFVIRSPCSLSFCSCTFNGCNFTHNNHVTRAGVLMFEHANEDYSIGWLKLDDCIFTHIEGKAGCIYVTRNEVLSFDLQNANPSKTVLELRQNTLTRFM